MNKMELVSAIAEKSDLSKRDAEAALNAFTDIVAEEQKEREEIRRLAKRWLFRRQKCRNLRSASC